jgi:CHAT domain-containing protein
VVLSGCDTALGRSTTTASSFGLTEAFLAAGAEFVVSALWPIDDRTTASEIHALYRRVVKNGTEITSALPLGPASQPQREVGVSVGLNAFRITIRP